MAAGREARRSNRAARQVSSALFERWRGVLTLQRFGTHETLTAIRCCQLDALRALLQKDQSYGTETLASGSLN